MKFFSVALLATLFCAAIVSAAPSSSEDPIFNEIAFSPYGVVTDKVKEIYEALKCAVGVAEKVAEHGSSNLQALVKQIKYYVVVELKKELEYCVKVEGVAEKYKCTLGVTKKVFTALIQLNKQVTSESKELAKEFYTQIKSECTPAAELMELDEDDEFELSADEFESNVAGDSGKKLKKFIQCLIKGVGDVVQGTDVESVWTQTVEELQAVLEKISNCLDNKSSIASLKCVFKESLGVYKLIGNFLKLVGAESYSLLYRIKDQIKECKDGGF